METKIFTWCQIIFYLWLIYSAFSNDEETRLTWLHRGITVMQWATWKCRVLEVWFMDSYYAELNNG